MSSIVDNATIAIATNNEALFKSIIISEDVRIVKELSAKFGFSIDEAMSHLSLENIRVKTSDAPVKNPKKSGSPAKIPLPFCGKKIDGLCGAIRLNHGLYTQCMNSASESVDGYDGTLCKTCKKQSETNSNNRPTYGFIEDRIKLGDDFKDPKGKEPVRYANIMTKLNISRTEAERIATNLGLEIDEKEFVLVKRSRGRPKKQSTAVDDTSGSDTESVKSTTTNVSEKKGRGRPKKDKQEVKKQDVEEVEEVKEEVKKEKEPKKEVKKEKEPKKEVKKEKKEKEPKKEKKEKEPKKKKKDEKDTKSTVVDNKESDPELCCSTYDDSDDEGITVNKIIIDGKEYLKAADNTLFNTKSHEEIGRLVDGQIEYDSDYDADED